MKIIGITLRVALESSYPERRDALDQRWIDFFAKCRFIPILLPNNLEILRRLISEIKLDGVLLTGGNDLKNYGGNTPERDRSERWLIKKAIQNKTPLVGVCRGMQAIQNHFHIPLTRVSGHVQARQSIDVNGRKRSVNSYHQWGSKGNQTPLNVFAKSSDGVVKAVRHPKLPVYGIMWHPERLAPFEKADIRFFRQAFEA